jgi:hypothetical protein
MESLRKSTAYWTLGTVEALSGLDLVATAACADLIRAAIRMMYRQCDGLPWKKTIHVFDINGIVGVDFGGIGGVGEGEFDETFFMEARFVVSDVQMIVVTFHVR